MRARLLSDGRVDGGAVSGGGGRIGRGAVPARRRRRVRVRSGESRRTSWRCRSRRGSSWRAWRTTAISMRPTPGTTDRRCCSRSPRSAPGPTPRSAPAAGPLTGGFRPHGLNLRPGPDGRHTLYVVRHGAREAIEVFELDARRRQRPVLTWTGCAEAPEGVTFNSVAALPGGGFAATHFARPAGRVWEWAPGVGLGRGARHRDERAERHRRVPGRALAVHRRLGHPVAHPGVARRERRSARTRSRSASTSTTSAGPPTAPCSRPAISATRPSPSSSAWARAAATG